MGVWEAKGRDVIARRRVWFGGTKGRFNTGLGSTGRGGATLLIQREEVPITARTETVKREMKQMEKKGTNREKKAQDPGKMS